MAPDRRRAALATGGLGGGLLLVALEPVSASNVAAGLGQEREVVVPTWLVLLTGSLVVGASGLLAALVTDRTFVDRLHEWSLSLWSTPALLAAGASAAGVLALLAVVVVGLEGPSVPTANLAVLLTFVGLRAVLPMIAFLVVNPWPAINPFRAIATGIGNVVEAGRRGKPARGSVTDGSGEVARGGGIQRVDEQTRSEGLLTYPIRLGSWPAVVGLAGLVWLEIVLPVTVDPRTLALLAVGYTGYTVCGALAFSPAVWFRRADPLAVVFRLYGALAPIQRAGGDDGRLQLALPGSRLRQRDVTVDSSEVAVVLLLVWELTFNGFVVTPPGAATVSALVGAGLPPASVYLFVLVAGYVLFWGAFHLATLAARRTAPTYLTAPVLARRFAPPLIAIAAGYHLAHYVAFAVSLSPAVAAAVANPLSPPVVATVLWVPDWFGGLEMAFLLVGHLLAVLVAHAIAFELFPGRVQAIRSQFPFVLVMIAYTALSLWLLSLPTAPPPFVDG